jgi:GMP synthase (glutamine-hydrolysing)
VDVLALVHGAGGGPSLFGEVIEARGDRVVEVRVHRGELPERRPRGYGAVLVLGGTAHPYEEEAHPWLVPELAYLERVLDEDVPALGICLGAELFTRAAGGRVERAAEPEIGWFPVELTDAAAADAVFSGLPRRFPSFQWHEYAAGIPPGAIELARNDAGAQAYRLAASVWGVQFHPEVRLSQLVTWIRSYGAAAPVAPEPFIRDAERHIAAWNDIGRELCTRFLDAAATL